MSTNIKASNLILGENCFVHPTARIEGVNGQSKSVVIGDNSYIGPGVQIFCDDFRLGDYCKIHNFTTIHGNQSCHIGHNAWIGQFTVIDCLGGTVIGNNCGIGAHSQLWSHIKYGDTLEGCRFNSISPLTIGNDVWFVGHCIVSPIKAEDKSMAFAGSVITSDMKFNEIYAGTPAKSISNKVGYQFIDSPIEEKEQKMIEYLNEFVHKEKDRIKILREKSDQYLIEENTYFFIDSRTYTKRLSNVEIEFMKFLLPEKAKFIPHDSIQ